MANTTPICNNCGLNLAAEDQFCSRCGTRTLMNNDPEATVLMQPGEHEASNSDVTVPVGQPAPAQISADTPFGDRLRAVLGHEFEIHRLLGEGGFARVYQARDKRLDRTVAIKVIRPEVVGTDLFTESFRNEGVALAKLRHPGIIPIYDIRERSGLIWYVMPFVEGITLDKRMKQGRIPPYETRRILSDLTDALSSAHRVKLVHLDIKPDNVFLEGDLQRVLLVDFGIAQAVTETVPDATDGPIVGTPAYMSPEQAKGLPEIDHRSDIYSLGVLGYAMLMGRPPFVGKPRDVLRAHVEIDPTPIRDINPTIPKDLADAVMRCLEKDPWDRFGTAKELRGALEAVTFFTGRPSTGDAGQPTEGIARLTLVIFAVAAFLLGLLIGILAG